MNVDLAVVIVSYNTVDHLRRCLGSLQRGLLLRPGLTYKAVVVDNGSTDGTTGMIAAEFPDVGLLALGENRGFAAANNVALRHVTARWYLLLNPDTLVLGDAVGELISFMAEHPAAGVVGGRLLNADLSFQHSCFRFPTLPMSFFDFFPLNHRVANSWLNGRYRKRDYNLSFPIDHPLGACMLVRDETVRQVGAFDEGFFMYCEEVDLCYRIKAAGWDIWYTPMAEVIHHGAASTRQVAGPMMVHLRHSRDRFFRKHYGATFAFLARQIVRAGLGAAYRNDKRELRAGVIRPDELNRRLQLYSEVME